MAQRLTLRIVGVDVSKHKLDVFEWEIEQGYSIRNRPEAIEAWLERFVETIPLAIEPTGRYHQALAEATHACGHQVWLINPYRLAHYREYVGQRVKANRQDARLLARYVARGEGELRLWKPLAAGERRF